MAGARELNFRLGDHGGSDGARTRDLRRDRPTIYPVNSKAAPNFFKQEMSIFRPKSERRFQSEAEASPQTLRR